MILVDTSVWVAYLSHGLPLLARLLQGLPAATLASDQEVLLLMEGEQLRRLWKTKPIRAKIPV